MAAKLQEGPKQEKNVQKEEKQRTLLKKLGFVQEMVEFYTAPIN